MKSPSSFLHARRSRGDERSPSVQRSRSHDNAEARLGGSGIFHFLTAQAKAMSASAHGGGNLFSGDDDTGVVHDHHDGDESEADDASVEIERMSIRDDASSLGEGIAVAASLEEQEGSGDDAGDDAGSEREAEGEDTDPKSGLTSKSSSQARLPGQYSALHESVEASVSHRSRDRSPHRRRIHARTTVLEDKLREQLGISPDDKLVGVYSCWLLKSVLLQGRLYLTEHYLCFFAYLPMHQSGKTIKTGSLVKKSRRLQPGSGHERFWFTLRKDSLAYFSNATDLYFPKGTIDLRYAVRAEIVPGPDGTKQSSSTFVLVTEGKTHVFKADSHTHAHEWVKALEKEIFHSRNEGDTVRIVIPLGNIIDIDDTSVLDLAMTVKVRAIDNDETYAIDDYVFTFFHNAVAEVGALRRDLASLGVPTPAASDVDEDGKKHNHDKEHRHTRALHSVFGHGHGHGHGHGRGRSRSPRTPIVSESVVDSTGVKGQHTSQLASGACSQAASRPRTPRKQSSGDITPARDGAGGIGPAGLSEAARKLEDVRARAASPRSHTPFRKLTSAMSNAGAMVGSAVGVTGGLLAAESAGALRNVADVATTSRSGRTGRETLAPSLPIESEPVSRPSSRRGSRHGSHPSSAAGSRHTSQPASQPTSPATKSTPTSPVPTTSDGQSSTLQDGSYTLLSPPLQSSQFSVTPSGATSEPVTVSQPSVPQSPQLAASSAAKQPKSMATKVREMWGGGRKHFRGPEEDEDLDDDKHADANERFRSHFSVGDAERLIATYYCHLQKAFPVYGKLYLSDNFVCFRSLLPGTSTKMILPLQDVENVTKEKGFRFGYSGLVFVIHGHEEVFVEFSAASNRDDCEMMVLKALDSARHRNLGHSAAGGDSTEYGIKSARLSMYDDALRKLPIEVPPMVVDQTRAVHNEYFLKQPQARLHFTMLTIGSRGDVQPYIALGKGLAKEGHTVRIATHKEFQPWIEKHGFEFREVAGDPGALMAIMIEHGMFSVSFLKDAASKFRDWITELLESSWEACQGTDLLIESPSAMAGLHIAEALKIPYFRAFTMPWTRTRAYPHAFIVPEQKMGGSYNYLTYVLFDNVFWKGISGQVNKWRKERLGLGRTNLDLMRQSQVPFLYNVSPHVLVPPVDYCDWVSVTGYWFLDEGSDGYEPPADLAAFIAKARADGAKLVYIGFGSIVVKDPTEMTKAVVAGVQRAKVRCILSKGWSDRFGKQDADKPEVPLPPEIFQIKAAPHDWLLPQMDAAVHHGGSGTTGASLRAGIPTIIKPFFGDQFFYAGRVEDLGVGVHLRKLTVNQLSKALWEATHNERIISRAAVIGRSIRAERGVATAIEMIYRNMGYARSLIREPNQHLAEAERADTMFELQRLNMSEADMAMFAEHANIAEPGADDTDHDHDHDHYHDRPADEDHSTDSSWSIVDRNT